MIIYFSGTGNTALAAKLLARDLKDDELVGMSTGMLLHPEEYTLRPKFPRIVWAFPTYSWGIPPVVVNFMRKVKLGEDAGKIANYMLTTCGDDMGYTDRLWRREMKNRGLRAEGAYAVQMPNTYVCMSGFDVDHVEVANAKIIKAPFAVSKIADSITGTGKSITLRKMFSFIKTYVIYPWFVRHAMSAKPFHATRACTGCNKCALSCPMQNISMEQRRPEWGERCAMCLRCYHICPVHAVAYGNKTKHKGQYKTELREV